MVVEGTIDCLKVWQAGVPNCLAILGSHFSDHHAERAVRWFGRLVVMMDGDKGGRNAADRIVKLLHGRIPVQMASLPEGHDPGDLLESEIVDLYRGLTSRF